MTTDQTTNNPNLGQSQHPAWLDWAGLGWAGLSSAKSGRPSTPVSYFLLPWAALYMANVSLSVVSPSTSPLLTYADHCWPCWPLLTLMMLDLPCWPWTDLAGLGRTFISWDWSYQPVTDIADPAYFGPCWSWADLELTMDWPWIDHGLTLDWPCWPWTDLGVTLLNWEWPCQHWSNLTDIGVTLLTLESTFWYFFLFFNPSLTPCRPGEGFTESFRQNFNKNCWHFFFIFWPLL